MTPALKLSYKLSPPCSVSPVDFLCKVNTSEDFYSKAKWWRYEDWFVPEEEEQNRELSKAVLREFLGLSEEEDFSISPLKDGRGVWVVAWKDKPQLREEQPFDIDDFLKFF